MVPESFKVVVKNYNSIHEMRQLLLKAGIEEEFVENKLTQINVLNDYHFGGYGKHTQELLDFIEKFELETKISLDQVYTGLLPF